MSTPSPFIVAAAPSAIVLIKALQTLITNLGTDPAQMAAKLPGALAVLTGTLEMQIPALAESELAAVQTDVNAKLDGYISYFEKVAKPA
jgi:hypothetical protein